MQRESEIKRSTLSGRQRKFTSWFVIKNWGLKNQHLNHLYEYIIWTPRFFDFQEFPCNQLIEFMLIIDLDKNFMPTWIPRKPRPLPVIRSTYQFCKVKNIQYRKCFYSILNLVQSFVTMFPDKSVTSAGTATFTAEGRASIILFFQTLHTQLSESIIIYLAGIQYYRSL